MPDIAEVDRSVINQMLLDRPIKRNLRDIITLGALVEANNNGHTHIFANLYEGEITENLEDTARAFYELYQNLGGAPLYDVAAPLPPLPSESLPEGVIPPERCFDPIMGENTNIDPAADMAYFYIMNAEGTEISSAACLDSESLQQYKLRDEYVFYKCKETVPIGALHIRPDSVEPTPYRLMNFSQRVYVTNDDAQRIISGESYILKPTGPIGRIASKRVIDGGDVVGALHCGPADPGNIIYSVQKMVERPAVGGSRKGRKSRKTRKQKRSKKNRKTRKH
jgi:hypothetical protein